MTPRQPLRVLLLLVLLPAALAGCARTVEGAASAAPAPRTPGTPEELESLLLTEVPSGLPRVPDAHLSPPAGEKSLEDVAGYAADPRRERRVLEDYGYRHGWERYWGDGATPAGGVLVTTVFVDQFEDRAGAGAYASDLAHNDAEHYGGMLREHPRHLPAGCRLLVVEDPDPATGLAGPAVFAWCPHGVFTVAVTAVARSLDAASAEVRAVVAAQLERLPPG